jgi:hypothetical protein
MSRLAVSSQSGHALEQWLPLFTEEYMKSIHLLYAATLVATTAFADNTAVEQEFGQLAAEGCKNRDGDFKETVDQRLNGLRENQTPVVVTLKCKGNATPVARNISYRTEDGSRGSISY